MLLKPVSVHAVVQVADADAEQFRSAFAMVAALIESGQDGLLLGLLDRLGECAARRSRGSMHFAG